MYRLTKLRQESPSCYAWIFNILTLRCTVHTLNARKSLDGHIKTLCSFAFVEVNQIFLAWRRRGLDKNIEQTDEILYMYEKSKPLLRNRKNPKGYFYDSRGISITNQ